jgi:hypothetical protein
MSREVSQTKQIVDDYGVTHAYECTQHGAEEGYKLLRTLLGILGEAAGQGLRTTSDGAPTQPELDREVTGAMLGMAVKVLCDRLDLPLIKRLLAFTTRTDGETGTTDKVPVAFNKIYQGNYGELAKALYFVLDHNYGPTLRARLDGGDTLTRIASLLKSAA